MPQQRMQALQDAEAAIQSIKRKSDELLKAMSNTEDPAAATQLAASIATSASQHIATLVQSWPQVQQVMQDASARYQAGSLQQAYTQLIQQQKAQQAASSTCAWCIAALGHLEQHLQQDYAPIILSSSPSEPAASSSPRAADPEELAAVVARLRQALPSMQVACYSSSPRGPVKASSHSVAEEVRLLCPGVLCASVQLLGPGVPYPLKVYVDAATRANDLDTWGPQPLHHVFRRITPLATRVMHYYLHTAPAAAALDGPPNKTPGSFALESLLLWLASYQDLYTRPCAVGGNVLAMDTGGSTPVPPLFRPFKLSRQQLVRAATSPEARVAYHMHAVPQALLAWPGAEPLEAVL